MHICLATNFLSVSSGDSSRPINAAHWAIKQLTQMGGYSLFLLQTSTLRLSSGDGRDFEVSLLMPLRVWKLHDFPLIAGRFV